MAVSRPQQPGTAHRQDSSVKYSSVKYEKGTNSPPATLDCLQGNRTMRLVN